MSFEPRGIEPTTTAIEGLHRLRDAVGPSAIGLGASAWRQKFVVLASLLLFLGGGIFYLWQAIPLYTSGTSILIDSKKVGYTATYALEGALAFDSGAVDSQVQVLVSDKLAGIVTDRLALEQNLQFMSPKASLIGSWLASVTRRIAAVSNRVQGIDAAPTLESMPREIRRQVAIERLKSNLKITRQGRSFVIAIEYSDQDRVLARDIAAAFAQSYVADQIETRVETSRNASRWLEDRIRELKAKATSADQTAQLFRARNNLTESSGRLINDQSLTDANTQLSVARAEYSSTKAKYDRLKQIIDSRDYAASVVDSMSNPLISQLRGKYLQASKTNSELSAKVGPDHYQAESARKEMNEYSKLIFDELSRILNTYESDLRISADKLASLEQSVARMKTVNVADSDALSRLKSLEQEAQTYNALYAALLQKFQETTQQQSFPVTDAGILTEATIPLRESSPRAPIVLLVSLLLGGIVGAGLGAWREFGDRGFRTSDQIREWLGLDFVSYMPLLPQRLFRNRRSRSSNKEGERTATNTNEDLDYVLSNPLSRYAESIRGFKVTLDVKTNLKRPVVVGFVSMLPDEGKSTTAKNFASLVAAHGERTLLIDADMRNPQLTRALTPWATHGLIEALRKTKPLHEMIVTETKSSLAFLPGATHRRFDAASDLFKASAMADVLAEAKAHYDVIVLDLPPVGILVDAAALSHVVDWYFLIAEWGKTPRGALRDMLLAEQALTDKIAGVALAKVDMKKLKSFGAYGAYGYQSPYRARYYSGDAA